MNLKLEINMVSRLLVVIAAGVSGMVITGKVKAVDYSITRELLQNGGFETEANWLVFQNGFKYVSANHSGSKSIRIDSSSSSGFAGAYQRVDLNQTEKLPVTLTGYIKGLGIENGGGYFGASLYVEVHLQDGTVVYWNSPANYGTFGWRIAGINIGNLPAVNQPINHIFVVAMLGNASGKAWFDDLKLTEFKANGAAVTFMFDDGEASTLVAKEVLDTKGFKASFPVPLDNVDVDGYLTKAQIQELVSSGWELMAHGISHDDLTQMSRAELTLELRQPQKKLSSMFKTTVKNIAFPFGAYSGDVVFQAQKFYRSGRAYEIGLNGGGSYPYDIKIKSLENSTDGSEVEGWINEAKANNQWLVLVGHKVSDTGDDKYYIPRTQLEEVVNVVATSGLPVVTYDQGLDLYSQ